MRRAAPAFALLLACLAPPVPAAEDVAAALSAAAEALAASESQTETQAALGAAMAAQERALSALRAALRGVAVERDSAVVALAEADAAAFAALAALDRIARAPSAALIAHPDGPVAAARAAMLFADAAPAMAARAGAARAALTRLEAAEADQTALAAALRDTLAAMADARAALAAGEATTDAAAGDPTDRLALRAAALSALLETRPAPAAAPPSEAGGWLAPLRGRLARGFGAETSEGPLAGVEIAAPAYSVARTPTLASLRYAGELRGRGLVAVLEPEEGLLIVLEGLAEIDRQVGETLRRGEPIGALGGPPPAAEEFLIDASAGNASIPERTLYIEVRRDGAPADPEHWFADLVEDRNG